MNLTINVETASTSAFTNSVSALSGTVGANSSAISGLDATVNALSALTLGWVIAPTITADVYQLQSSDVGVNTLIPFSSPSAQVVVLSPSTTGAAYNVMRQGDGTVTLSASGVTLNFEGISGPTGITQGGTINIVYLTSTYVNIYGDFQ